MRPSYIVLTQTSGPVQVPRPSSGESFPVQAQGQRTPSPASSPSSPSGGAQPTPQKTSLGGNGQSNPSPDQLGYSQPTNPTMATVSLQIQDRQVSHFRRVLEILANFYFYIDGSEMRTGKTYIAGGVALHMKLPVIVFCPNRVRPVWIDFLTKHGIPGINLPETGCVMSYDCLRSRKGHQPRHGLLERLDGPEGVTFTPTTLLIQLLQAGIFVIFDECQKLKNTSDQYRAAKALMSQVYTVGGRSRVGFLSGTTMDKPEHAINFLRMVRFIEQRNLYSKIHGETRLEGVADLHNWANRVNSTATARYIASHQFKSTKAGSVEYVFDLFTQVIKPSVMSIMPSLQTPKDIKNGYYALDPADEQEYRRAVSALADAVRYNHREGTVNMKDNMGAITTALERIQVAKYKMVARLVRRDLTTPMIVEGVEYYPKVIVFCDYYKAIDLLLQELVQLGPVEFTGRIPDAQGQANLAAFNEPNLRCRLIVGNPLVGGLGISMRDTDGRFPRKVYIMPGYRVMDLHQTAHRPYPDTGPVTSTVRFVYGLSGARENSILNACARKGEVMKKLHEEQGVKFPNEYESEYERQVDGLDWEDREELGSAYAESVVSYPTEDDRLPTP